MSRLARIGLALPTRDAGAVVVQHELNGPLRHGAEHTERGSAVKNF